MYMVPKTLENALKFMGERRNDMYMICLKFCLEFMGESLEFVGEMTYMYMVCLKVYGRNDMYMVPKTLANALNFIREMTCTWLSLKFALILWEK